ncbi:TerB family tellurite resistance protein [Sedimentibacter saalensis]|uniref:Putative tellurite resistance protein B-like protein n=1 Tax=Sedimentibacter saalensis TaxID=130788 RepID=A0A562JK45_9FIRM|nr:TerB family tellurite resistance protein [Sedimentibacter saalensis]TWH83642.1 putative tellurite resistance protein B-like protein [Sedimentibacter saalensis]
MNLRKEEKNSYLQAIMFIVSCDGVISGEEITALKNIASRMGITMDKVNMLTEEVADGKALKNILSRIKNRQTKLQLMYDLVNICHSDGQYSEIERKSMERVTKLLKVEAEKLVEIEGIVNENIEFSKKTKQVLEVSNEA